MFKNRNQNCNNLCGKNISRLRAMTRGYLSQRQMASDLTDMGLKLNKNAIQRIESGQRFVSDIELLAFARYFSVSVEQLLE